MPYKRTIVIERDGFMHPYGDSKIRESRSTAPITRDKASRVRAAYAVSKSLEPVSMRQKPRPMVIERMAVTRLRPGVLDQRARAKECPEPQAAAIGG